MFTQPKKTKALKILEVLKKRTTLLTEQQDMYKRLSNGYHGERKFASLLQKHLHHSYISLFDAHLNVNGIECQIDCLLIFQNDIYLLQIKSYRGDYYTENNRWYSVSTGEERKNPLQQLNRSNLLMREFISQTHSHLNLKSYIIFVNHDYYLYPAPLNIPIIFQARSNAFCASSKLSLVS